MTDRIALSGAPGSPYTRKMLAYLRYRRIPYRFLSTPDAERQGLPRPKVQLLPTFYLPGADGALEAVTDSTPLIRRLETDGAGRPVLPADPALAVIDALLEDYADEWLTKAMFHYRWTYQADIDKAAITLPAWRNWSIPDAVLKGLAASIAERQIGRLGVVGSNAVTGPVIEASYRRYLTALEAHLTGQPFLLGARPASADFAAFGQLTQLAQFDPTPMALAQLLAPRVCAWVAVVEDLSGLEPEDADWISLEAQPKTLHTLLAEVGRVYAPVMTANAQALRDGASEVVCEVDGAPWRQTPFPYQAKCLGWLRQAHADLSAADRARVDAVLDGTGCEALFA
jgi:glutathione S-transferase